MEFTTNKWLKELVNDTELTQREFAKKIGCSQAHLFSLIHSEAELKFSKLQRIGEVFNVEYEIRVVKDSNTFEFDLIKSLKSTEVKLIKEFSKETYFDKKLDLHKKIEAIKVLLDK